MNDNSRNQGAIICAASAVLALLFVIGVLRGSYLALALPVAALTLFALGLAFWVGWTIYTIQVEPEPPTDPPAPSPAEQPGSSGSEGPASGTDPR